MIQVTHRYRKKTVSESEIPTGYTDEMYVPIAYYNGTFHEVGKIKKADIIPNHSNNGCSGKIYYHIPLHFGERCLGYFVTCNPKIQIDNSTFETMCINISNSLENVRKLICLENAIMKLDKLYALDPFSGIYNRNGFMQATKEIYTHCAESERDIMLMFIDLDGLKRINDTFGHSVGDQAICNIADVIVKTCTSGEIYCRFGGDEFIIFAADYTENDAQKLTNDIKDQINQINSKKENPYVLSASTGYVIAKPKIGEDIFRFVSAADNMMYSEKKKKKLSRYLKS